MVLDHLNQGFFPEVSGINASGPAEKTIKVSWQSVTGIKALRRAMTQIKSSGPAETDIMGSGRAVIGIKASWWK